MLDNYPEILGIEKGLTQPSALKIIERIKSHNPTVKIKEYEDKPSEIYEMPPVAAGYSQERPRWEAAKRALILREKKARPNYGNLRFVHVFVSDEKAQEDYSFVVSMENECPYRCEMCYLQSSLKGAPVPTIFTNLQEDGLLLREIKIALLAMHMHTQTHSVKNNIGRVEQRWVHLLMGVLNKALPDKLLDIPIQEIFADNIKSIKQAVESSGLDVLTPIHDKLNEFSFKKTERSFKFSCGELGDGLANDHFTKNSKFIVELFSTEVMRNDGAILVLTSKSDNISTIKQATPTSNIIFAVTIGTPKYVIGPPTITRRLEAAQSLLILGFNIQISIDPIVFGNSTIQTYKRVLDKIANTLDHTNDHLVGLTLGMLRFGEKNLTENIQERHLDLYHHVREQMKRPHGEEKYRYDYSERVNVYKELAAYSNSIMPGVKVRLSTEAISVWEDVGLTWE